MKWRDLIESRPSALCVGLDPVPGRLPDDMDPLSFCREVFALTREFAACFKPNIGFFERYGPEGVAMFADLVREIREQGFAVISDVKRSDMGGTAQAYADAFFGGPFDSDAITVNPFLGLDALEPYRQKAKECDAGVIVLLRTSNPGAPVFQDAAEATLVEAIAAEPAFGAVVGATHPADGARLRAALPETFFLVPGFGAQGGDEGLAGFFDDRGRGAVVSSSRGILYAGEGQSDWRSAVAAAAEKAHTTIERVRNK
ncbi:MAG: orotidine-5'-phosphate decarboxylase [Planctomycetota bacterium]